MAFSLESHRCPQCNALVVDRRSPTCTTCHVALPADWILTPEQTAKLNAIDKDARAEYNSAMTDLDGVKSGSDSQI